MFSIMECNYLLKNLRKLLSPSPSPLREILIGYSWKNTSTLSRGGGEEESKTTCNPRGEHLEATHSEALAEPEFKEFRVGDILTVIPTIKPSIEGKGGYIKDDEIIEEDGVYPYIAAVSTNNGIKGWTSIEPENSAGSITLSTTADSSNTIFYQPVDYVGRQQIAKIQHKDLSPLTEREAMYISTLLRKITQSFNYGNKLTKDSLVNTLITLPATPSEEPDWEYMEDYIKNVEKQERERIGNYVLNKRKESCGS